MRSLRDIARNIKPDDVVEITEEIQPINPIEWKELSRSLLLTRTFEKGGEHYCVIFEHRPTMFKTRGRYHIIKKGDKVKALEMLGFKNTIFVNFTINDFGELLQKENVPFLNLDNKPEFLALYEANNTGEVVVNDLLDLLDFISLLGGSVHMNPLKEVPKLTEYTEKGAGRFKLGEIQDYQREVHEFITSKEKPTLSYRYLVSGYENDNGVEVEKKKFFSYPLLTNTGVIGVDTLEFTVPLEKNTTAYIEKYIGHLIVPYSKGIYKENKLYFIVDTSKLEGIRTLHEIPLTEQLIHDRERARLMLKSLAEFKKVLKNLAKRVGTPIREVNMYSYEALEKIEGGMSVVDKVIYSSRDTRAGDTKFKEILEKSGVKSMTYVEDLIVKYLDGKLDLEFLDKHIVNSDRVFKYQSLNEALKILFSSITGKNLGEMFSLADNLTKALEVQGNSLKMRTHVFKETEGELEDFLLRALSHLPSNSNINQRDYQILDFRLGDNDLSIMLKTEIKY